MKNIANDNLINEVKFRLNNLNVDSISSIGQLEQLISDTTRFGVPELMTTERPDKTSDFLLSGRVSILLNGNPYSIIAPITFIDFLSSPEDKSLGHFFANFLKILRLLSALITLLLPGLYIAITSYHQEILPTELLYSIIGSRQNVPFPLILELLVLEISFEIIREAGLRVPSPLGSTIGIIGAIILGEAAVSAGIVSPILIIIVAITGISSYAIPDFSFGFHLRLFRFIFIILGFISGFLGIGLCLFCYISLLCSLKSFGVDYMVPYAPFINSKGNSFLLLPIWKREFRAPFIKPKIKKYQDKISMDWRN